MNRSKVVSSIGQKYLPADEVMLDFKKPAITKTSYTECIAAKSLATKSVKDPVVSVIIVTFKEVESTNQLLRALQTQTLKKYEIIVVDNGLPETAAKKLHQDSSINYIKLNENMGPSVGRNVGAAFASAPIVAFIDSDGTIKKDYLHEIIAAFSDKKTVGIRGKVIAQTKDSYVPNFYNLGKSAHPTYINLEGVSAWRTKDFCKVGGFEASLYGMEGAVLTHRMHEYYGYKLEQFQYAPSVALHHDYDAGVQHLQKKALRTARASAKVRLRYPFLTVMLDQFKALSPETQQPESEHEYTRIRQEIEKQVADEYQDYYDELSDKRWNNQLPINKPVFSVVIAYRNSGATLVETIGSLFRQSLTDIEIIIVDDASNDPHSLRVLDDLAQYEAITVLHSEKNVGCGEARNIGIRNSHGKYIACIDADDTYSPTYLEKAYNVFEADETAGVVGCWTQSFGAKNGQWKPNDPVQMRDALVDSPVPVASCFRKKVWEELDGYHHGGYPENRHEYEDWTMWLSTMKSGWRIRVLQSIEFNYRVSSASLSARKSDMTSQRMGYLVGRFADLFAEHHQFIIIEKQRKLISERIQNRVLQEQNNELLQRVKMLEQQLGLKSSAKRFVKFQQHRAIDKIKALHQKHKGLQIHLKDSLFAHGHNAARGNLSNLPQNFRFDRRSEHPIAVFTDKNLRDVVRSHAKVNIAWLLESPEYHGVYYEYISKKEHYERFDIIYTFDKQLLELDSRFHFLPIGGSWIPDDGWKIYDKTKNVSIIASGKTSLSGHKLRHGVVQKFGNQIDAVMGNGYAPFEHKLDALKPFRYSIVIENTRTDHYFTEKLLDCFATGVVPIYWGCPSIGDFFNMDGVIVLKNVNDLVSILTELSPEDYQHRESAIKDNFERARKYVMPEDAIYDDLKKNYDLDEYLG